MVKNKELEIANKDQDLKRQKSAKDVGMEDFLLEDFPEEQREYVVKTVYPELKQSMRHVSTNLE